MATTRQRAPHQGTRRAPDHPGRRRNRTVASSDGHGPSGEVLPPYSPGGSTSSADYTINGYRAALTRHEREWLEHGGGLIDHDTLERLLIYQGMT